MSFPLLQIQSPTDALVLASLAIIAVFGVVALISPRHFGLISARGSTWVDSNQIVEKLDRRINIDHHVIPWSRVLGAAVLVAVCYLGYVYFTHFQQLSSSL